MNNNSVYKWKLKDTIIVDILFITPFIGIIFFLSLISISYLIIFLFLYILMNLLLSIICSNCPYSGKFCPGISQLLFGPILSKLYKKKPIKNNTLKIVLISYCIIGLGCFIYAYTILFIYLISEYAIVIATLLLCFILYCIIAWPILCPKCSNNKKCPVKNPSTIIRNNK